MLKEFASEIILLILREGVIVVIEVLLVVELIKEISICNLISCKVVIVNERLLVNS